MNPHVIRTLCLAAALALAVPAWARPRPQGRSFREVQAPYAFTFPRDHGSHPGFAYEWWYLTGWFEEVGVGFQFTVFRVGVASEAVAELESDWAVDEVFIGHLALATPDGLEFTDVLARPPVGRASTRDLDVRVKDWSLRREGPVYRLKARGTAGGLDLVFDPGGRDPIAHGEEGVHRKGDHTPYASHYLTHPRLPTRGILTLEGRDRPVEGETWFDHEFFSQGIAEGQVGWDWAGLHLEDGTDLMLIRLRASPKPEGQDPALGDATVVRPDRTVRRIPHGGVRFEPLQHWESPHSGARYPVATRIRVPEAGYDLELRPRILDCEIRTPGSTRVTYWEGPVRVQGTGPKGRVRGVGYYELTGYTGSSPFPDGKTWNQVDP